MNTNKFLWFLYLAMFVVSILLGGFAWQAARQASVVVEWSTATELDTAGFNVYRGDTPEGPFERVNSQLIPASPDPLTGGEYAYEDRSVAPGRTYFYELEDVEVTGQTSRFGPIEVQARRGGTLELFLAILLFSASLLGAWLLRRPPGGSQPAPQDQDALDDAHGSQSV